jgi:hypothetical protein
MIVGKDKSCISQLLGIFFFFLWWMGDEKIGRTTALALTQTSTEELERMRMWVCAGHSAVVQYSNGQRAMGIKSYSNNELRTQDACLQTRSRRREMMANN